MGIQDSEIKTSINKLAKKCFEDAYERGWYDPAKSDLETLAMVITEVCEAVEEIRNHQVAFYYTKNSEKPEGWGVEVADAIIRLLDFAAYKGLDIGNLIETKLEYNLTRTYRHGGKEF